MPPLPGVLSGILSAPGGGIAPPAPSQGTSRNRMLANAERENWPDFIRAQYGLPARSAPAPGPPLAPLAQGIAGQYPLLNALMAGGDMGVGLRNVGSGAAMSRLAPNPQTAIPGFINRLT